MIQRIQTVYLLLAAIVSAVCLFLQIGYYEPETMGVGYRLYNLYALDADRAMTFRTCPLFVLLVAETIVSIFAVFKYGNRKQQARLCTASMVILLFWNITAIAYGYLFGYEGHTFHFAWPAFLPALAFFLVLMARRGILSDERLVRAADRIR